MSPSFDRLERNMDDFASRLAGSDMVIWSFKSRQACRCDIMGGASGMAVFMAGVL